MIRRPISMPPRTTPGTGSSGGNPTPRMNGRSFRAAWGGATAFFFSVSPWRFRDGEWRHAREKLLRAEDSGAAGLGILFDDVPETSASDLAERQLLFAERALEGTGLPVVLCPSVYCGEFMESFPGGEEYLDTWRKDIPYGWKSFWTGPRVVSPSLSDTSRAEQLLGSPPVIWDNLLATDYCLRRVFLAGVAGRKPEKSWWFLNPSEIFPAALHAVMELKASAGLPREWPEALGEHTRGWELMREFHHSPWKTGETGGEIIARLSGAISGNDPGDAVVWLNGAVEDMSRFVEDLPLIEGGWGLVPLARDLYRSLSIIRRALLSPDPVRELDYLMRIRLPYENPMAELAAGKP